jgi:uncharacterized protein YdbL (DUF1318 family)
MTELAVGLQPRAVLAGLLAMSALGACVTVKPVILDRKTQLENQILGTFQRLEDELILASSVRGERAVPALSPLQREALEAMLLREFIRDDIEELKSKQIVGEATTGMLVVLTLPSDAEQAKRAQDLLAQENGARQIILQRVISSSRELGDKDRPLVQRLFYRLNVQTARNGDRVQQENGAWMTVTAEGKR